MAGASSGGYAAASGLDSLDPAAVPIFAVEGVQLQFDIAADFVAAQVADNALILALATGRLLRIDLRQPKDIDDIDLPKKSSDIGVIRRMFLDPTASHLLITTTANENFYLHSQSRQPKLLPRLKGVPVEAVAWNPAQPTSSTREILVGSSDGNIYEVLLEPSSEFYRREERFVKSVHRISDGPVTGLWVDTITEKPEVRRILVASNERLYHFAGRTGRQGNEGGQSIYTRLFETESPFTHENAIVGQHNSMLAVSPELQEDAIDSSRPRAFGWLASDAVFYGDLLTQPAAQNLGNKVLAGGVSFQKSRIPSLDKKDSPQIDAVCLSQWHVLMLLGSRVVAVNRLNNKIVWNQVVLDEGETPLGFAVDQKQDTYWLFTSKEIYEIVIRDEDRDVWEIMLEKEQFDAAMKFAKTARQKDVVATTSGDHLVRTGDLLTAASIYGRSNKPFEEVAMTFLNSGNSDALRKYLLTKLPTYKKAWVMQRVMVATWLVEIYMTKLNSLDDTLSSRVETEKKPKDELQTVRQEFRDLVTKYKSDLDQKTVYEIIASHAREEELLFYALTVKDYSYVLAYWVQRERWSETLNVLKKQVDPTLFYKYCSVLMSNVPMETVEILMRNPGLNPRSLIPAMLNYNKNLKGSLNQNQAVRYLHFVIDELHSTDAAVHNTLISIYASHPTKDETALLSYLETHSQGETVPYDADFALRLCVEHKRVHSCVHIYSSIGQFYQAVSLALKHDEIELAAIVADRPEESPSLRKKLWLAVAKKVISHRQENGIKTAIEFLKRCELLKIEDLIPFFPDFVIIDDFKDEICSALEDYSRNIDLLKKEMDSSASTAAHIKEEIDSLSGRYAIVEPGERCYVCQYPLLTRMFYVFPCQHSFHGDCLSKEVVKRAGIAQSRQIRDLQRKINDAGGAGAGAGPGAAAGSSAKREKAIAELDALVAASCILCSELAVKMIDEPFITDTDDRNEWAL